MKNLNIKIMVIPQQPVAPVKGKLFERFPDSDAPKKFTTRSISGR